MLMALLVHLLLSSLHQKSELRDILKQIDLEQNLRTFYSHMYMLMEF